MTQPFIVCCDGAEPPRLHRGKGDHDLLEIRQHGKDANLWIKSIDSQIFENLDPICKDLVDIASYVYAADRLVSRGSAKDVGFKWRRTFRFHLPVRCLRAWRAKRVKGALEEALSFLSDDHFEFQFCQRTKDDGQQSLFPFQEQSLKDADAVSLFSGGMDSLAGVVDDVATNGRSPILVSHWPIYRTKSRQARLVELLRKKLPSKPFPHVQALVHLVGPDHHEATQRSRSFLYLSLAAVVAKQLRKDWIRIYENGVVALNLPIWRQSVGAMDTRTAHPKFLSLFQELVRTVLHAPITIENTLFLKTRAETAKLLADHNCQDLIEATTSCSRMFYMPEEIPHCGVCSQCIDRRVALEATDLRDRDTPYQNRVFCEDLDAIEAKRGWMTSKAKAMAVGYVRSAIDISKLSLGEFSERYPEVYDAVPYLGIPEEHALEEIYNLQKRHSDTVLSVMNRLVQKHSNDLVTGKLSRGSLIGIVAAQGHLQEPMKVHAARLADILASKLPVVFQSHPPKDEKEVKDAAQALLDAAGEKLDREFPHLSFAAVVGTIPDFASKDQRLFVEVKYPRPRTRPVRAIVNEMTNKILQYQQNEACVLFVVYDHHRLIGDRVGFRDGFQKHPGVYTRVVV